MFQIDSQQFDLVNSAINGRGISECTMDMCAFADPCANGGTCQNLAASFNCVCRLGYVGDNCSTGKICA